MGSTRLCDIEYRIHILLDIIFSDITSVIHFVNIEIQLIGFSSKITQVCKTHAWKMTIFYY